MAIDKSESYHPINKHKWSLPQTIADMMANFAGSWGFIFSVLLFVIIWIIINVYVFLFRQFDPYPFVFLNLVLAVITATLTPIILMSQNRQSQKDRIRADYDYQINKKSEREIRDIQADLEEIKTLLRKKK